MIEAHGAGVPLSMLDMVDKRGRRLLQVRLTPRARQALDTVAQRHRLTLTALFEALGELTADGHEVFDKSVIDRAAAIDQERLNR